MMWRRALAAYLLWLLAHVVAGVVIALVAPLFMRGDFALYFLGNGLLDGGALGVAQWLALRPFLPKLRLWAPATIVVTPVNWVVAYVVGFFTFGFLGWIGAGVSAFAQWVLLDRSTSRPALSFLWVPASLIGGAIFYFAYFTSRDPFFQPLFAGTMGYAIVTGLVVALLVGKSQPKPA